jgi:predicted metallo-beta-lactamase superfamily hydrolase
VSRKIKVTPLAEESLGVRSMCTLIETPDTKILLDAGAALAPKRLGYPPHPREYQALEECRKRIVETAQKTDITTISHYHFDHHTPSYTDWFTNWSTPETAKAIYQNKLVLAKSYRSKVNASQRRRGWMFTKTGGEHAKKVESADGKTFQFTGTTLKFSEPVFHGVENSELGWVLMSTVEYGDEKVVFTSDVQGPIHTQTLNTILAEKPQLVIIGGPPTYLAGFKVKEEQIETGIQNLKTLAENVPTTILGHHILRDENWEKRTQPVFDTATQTGHKVLTAAEYLGKENKILECRRRQLFETEPPSSDFTKWLKLPLQKRKQEKPPI